MPYSVRYSPIASRSKEPWVKVELRTGKIVSRHRTKAKAKASIRAYYATRNQLALNAANPLRLDPTRTTMIRRQFMADVAARFRRLKVKVQEFMVEHDALGLGERKAMVVMASPREYQFLTDPDKLKAFQEWFQQQVKAEILSVPRGVAADQPWTAKYVESAYKRGQINAYLATRSVLDPSDKKFIDSSQASFLRSSFQQPETVSKIRLLALRSFEDMKGVSAQMGANLNRFLAQGLADGSGPREIAKAMAENIDNLTRTRALLIARTETIHAHAEGQLDAFDRLGVKELGIKAEWSTAGDDRVCDQCGGNEGQIFDMEEARGMIPLHPNCRCTWIPSKEGAEKKQ